MYCQDKAGFLKRCCRDCARLVAILQSAPESFGYRELLDRLLATDIPGPKIEKFLDADIDGSGSINDQITARMTNQIMTSLGQPSQMTSKDVKQVRKDIAEGRAPSQTDREVLEHGD